MKVEYLKQAWLVLSLALGFGAALAGVHLGLSGRIEQNKIDETYGQIPKLVIVAERRAEKDLTEEWTYQVPRGAKKAERLAYKAFAGPREAPEHIGWVLKTVGQGFADKIELLIGLDAEGERILGIYVLDQKETPGLGDKISPAGGWDVQFAGKRATEDVTVVKTRAAGNQVQAITGATVSSRSVAKIVNRAVIEFRNARILAALKPGKDKQPK